MLFRVFVSLGLVALGYYVGREIGRGEPIRKEMEDLRQQERRNITASPPQSPRSSDDKTNE